MHRIQPERLAPCGAGFHEVALSFIYYTKSILRVSRIRLFLNNCREFGFCLGEPLFCYENHSDFVVAFQLKKLIAGLSDRFLEIFARVKRRRSDGFFARASVKAGIAVS